MSTHSALSLASASASALACALWSYSPQCHPFALSFLSEASTAVAQPINGLPPPPTWSLQRTPGSLVRAAALLMRVHCRYGATETAAAASLTVGSDFSCFIDAHVGPPMAHSTIALRDVGEMNYFVGDASDYATDEAITAKFQSVFHRNPLAQFADSTRSLNTSNERPSDRYF